MVPPTMHYLLTREGPGGSVVAFGCSDGVAPLGVALTLERTTAELEIVTLQAHAVPVKGRYVLYW